MGGKWKNIVSRLRNKYVLSLLLFLVWILFFDANNLLERYSMMRETHRMEKNKHYFRERIIADSIRMNELKTDKDNLEKFAREQYLMKKDDEDIFVIIQED
jgi:cell division protein DivIC